MSLLAAARATVRFEERGRSLVALQAVSFAVERAERVGLVGPSGAGKSTLLRAALGLVPLAEGTITFDGQPVHGAPPALRARFQPVFQDSRAALDPRFTVAACLEEPLRVQGRPRGPAVVRALLEQVRLPALMASQRPGALSAGQRQRVALARALALEPELLLLDEPFSSLDGLARAQLAALLEELTAARGTAFLLASHDPALVARLCGRVLRLERGALSGPEGTGV